MRVISYGGGVQSTALVVLAAQGRIGPVDAALFSNVGDDSEHPATLSYVREVAIPWGVEHGVDVVEIRRQLRDGTELTLRQALERPESRRIEIPLRMANGSPGNRACTPEWKINVVRRWCREHGSSKRAPADVLIGFSTDEVERVGNGREHPAERKVYPLLDLGLSRTDCMRLIADAGLPVPTKSSCYFCPYRSPTNFAEMRRDEPALFAAAADVERAANRTRDRLGKDHVFLTRFAVPLEDAITEAGATLFDGPEQCDDGYCWT